MFLTSDVTAITSCTIDHDDQQQFVDEPFLNHITCSNHTPLSPGVHNLTITVHEYVLFDGLFYTPTVTSLPDSGVDVIYAYEGGDIGGGTHGKLWVNSTRNDTSLADAGDRLNVEFNGQYNLTSGNLNLI